jgi:hypothetical protein
MVSLFLVKERFSDKWKMKLGEAIFFAIWRRKILRQVSKYDGLIKPNSTDLETYANTFLAHICVNKSTTQ